MDRKAAAVDELIALALTGDEDDERAWEAIRALHLRGGADVLDAAKALLASESARVRGRGVDILAQLGTTAMRPGDEASAPDPELVRACADAMIALLEREADPLVLDALGAGLGHRPDPRAVPLLARHAHHPDERVRLAVVLGLTPHAEPVAVDVLIQLSGDPDRDVRNWATFGLGSQLDDVDTPELREALVRRLDDEDAEIRGEALVGLAARDDPRVRAPLRRELERPRVIILAVEAAERLGDPTYLPLLEALRDSQGEADAYFERVLDGAIAALRAK